MGLNKLSLLLALLNLNAAAIEVPQKNEDIFESRTTGAVTSPIASSTWSMSSPPPPWGARSGHSFSASANNTVYIIGGYGQQTIEERSSSKQTLSSNTNPPLLFPLMDVWSSNDMITWSLQTTNASFGARIDGAVAAGVVIDEKSSATSYTLLLITGGRRPAGGGNGGGGPLGKLLNDCYSSIDNGVTWLLKSGGSLGGDYPAVYGHSLVYDGSNNVFVSLGGLTPSAISDVYYTEDEGITWKAARLQFTWSSRAFMAAAVYETVIYICGGTDLKQSFSDVYYIIGKDITKLNVWMQSGALQSPWGSRDSASLLIAQDVLWIIGGRLGVIDPNTGLSIANDVWRSSSIQSANPSTIQWELVEDHTGNHIEFGSRFGMGAVVLPSSSSSSSSSGNATLFIFGGFLAQSSSNSQFSPIPVNDVWKSSLNLFCENASVVCNNHGSCSDGPKITDKDDVVSISTPYAADSTQSSQHKLIEEMQEFTYGLPPLPVTCTCNEGYTGSRCEELVCNSKTCFHGKCKIANNTPPNCTCDDYSSWTGPNCNIAVCAPGCLHGSCLLLPGGCRCEAGWFGPLCNEEPGLLRTVGFFITINAGNSFLSVTLIGVLTVLIAVVSVNRAAVGAPSLYELAISTGKYKKINELMPLLPLSSSRSGASSEVSSKALSTDPQQPLLYAGGGDSLYSASSSTSLLEKITGGNISSGSSGSGDDSSSSELTAGERLARKVRSVDGAAPLMRSDGIMRSRHGEAVAFSPKRRSVNLSSITSPKPSEEGGQSLGNMISNTPIGQLKVDDHDRELRHTHSALTILSGGGDNGASSKRRVRFNAVQEERFFDVNDALPILQPLTSPSASLRSQQQQQ
jgi:hypothetical protein